MNQHVHCIINNCHYWKEGNKCLANEILVTPDAFASEQLDSIDATMAKQLTPAAADSCMSTCCKTFVPKSSAKINADNITKMS
ncbi:DUF1540 domain-containing protein [Desulfoscipio sp. XC116]|uniref:DUF1540 domain-containing protein n=1 Tax=Desulfoscipio sp. XC116 TaxID=3144975 RepID=UPI00325A4C9B